MIEAFDGRMQRLKVGDIVQSLERGDRLMVVGISEPEDGYHSGPRMDLVPVGNPFSIHAYECDGDTALHGYWKTGA